MNLISLHMWRAMWFKFKNMFFHFYGTAKASRCYIIVLAVWFMDVSLNSNGPADKMTEQRGCED